MNQRIDILFNKLKNVLLVEKSVIIEIVVLIIKNVVIV